MSETVGNTSGSTGRNIVIAVLGLVVLGLLVLLMINPPGSPDAGAEAPGTGAPAAAEDQDAEAPEAGAPDAEAPGTGTPDEVPVPEPNPEYEAFLLSLADRVENDPMAKGAVDAPVVLIEWADFQCGYCQQFANETHPRLESYVDDGQLRIEYRDIALFGEESLMAAAGARAAGVQGLFWEYHTIAYAALGDGAGPITDDLLIEWAEQAGVPDPDRWETDYRSDEVRQAVAISSLAADEIGISSTPTFVIGTEVIMGAQPFEVFQQVIERQLASDS